MIGDSAFCCLPVDIAVRLIGTISLLKNALVFVALASDLDEVTADDKVRIIFGFDSEFFKKGDGGTDAEWFPIFCLVFTVVAAISSALLILASITAQRWLTVPWLLCSLFNVTGHFTSLVMLSLTRFSSADKWVTAFTVAYSVIILYFILVVMAADYMWCVQSKEQYNFRSGHEVWENIHRSPPLFQSPYQNQTESGIAQSRALYNTRNAKRRNAVAATSTGSEFDKENFVVRTRSSILKMVEAYDQSEESSSKTSSWKSVVKES